MQGTRRVVQALLGLLRLRGVRRGTRVLVMEQDGRLKEARL